MQTVVFDFDKTLTDKDTFNDFIFFCGRTSHYFVFKKTIYLTLFILGKCRILTNKNLKQIGLNLFLSNNMNEINRQAFDFSKTIEMKSSVQSILESKNKNTNIIICSASPENYIKCLFPNVNLIGLKFEIMNKKLIIIQHPYRDEKRKLLEKYVDRVSELYTDSISDKYLAQMSNKIYLVRNDTIELCLSYKDFLKKSIRKLL